MMHFGIIGGLIQQLVSGDQSPSCRRVAPPDTGILLLICNERRIEFTLKKSLPIL